MFAPGLHFGLQIHRGCLHLNGGFLTGLLILCRDSIERRLGVRDFIRQAGGHRARAKIQPRLRINDGLLIQAAIFGPPTP
ncbi:Uncharacterised protein [Klebsiella pneumoniae]|uniref:Uncharacterized protein n=1 Tax=Klebsiella pneumoniae TaxID=573 RepID=A0A4P0XYQ8_KLEPN|nr:Uncharacterised protein [Klebsiella pneumoniae]